MIAPFVKSNKNANENQNQHLLKYQTKLANNTGDKKVSSFNDQEHLRSNVEAFETCTGEEDR